MQKKLLKKVFFARRYDNAMGYRIASLQNDHRNPKMSS